MQTPTHLLARVVRNVLHTGCVLQRCGGFITVIISRRDVHKHKSFGVPAKPILQKQLGKQITINAVVEQQMAREFANCIAILCQSQNHAQIPTVKMDGRYADLKHMGKLVVPIWNDLLASGKGYHQRRHQYAAK